jgi:peptide/nickel transport system ATP-binding protein
VLEVEQLSISFGYYESFLARGRLHPVRAIDLSLEAGEMLAVVGASGAGKSLLVHAILGLLPVNARVSGTIRFCGDLLSAERVLRLRGRQIAFIPQSVSYLNPLWRVGGQVRRAARLSGMGPESAVASTREAFERYALERRVAHLFPFQLSGGMSKRVLTAAATVGAAKLILADEPTAGLDRDNSRKMLSYLRKLSDAGRSVLLITHDLAAALRVADKVAVVRDGITVEMTTCAVFAAGGETTGRHPYTRQLFEALPENKFISGVNGKSGAFSGNGHRRGCCFHAHCSLARAICLDGQPPRRATDGGWVRCHLA